MHADADSQPSCTCEHSIHCRLKYAEKHVNMCIHDATISLHNKSNQHETSSTTAVAGLSQHSHLLLTTGGVKASLSEEDMHKVVMRTEGYSGSDMRNLIQEACQGPVRDAVARHGAAVAHISEDDLRPVVVRDFQVGWD